MENAKWKVGWLRTICSLENCLVELIEMDPVPAQVLPHSEITDKPPGALCLNPWRLKAIRPRPRCKLFPLVAIIDVCQWKPWAPWHPPWTITEPPGGDAHGPSSPSTLPKVGRGAEGRMVGTVQLPLCQSLSCCAAPSVRLPERRMTDSFPLRTWHVTLMPGGPAGWRRKDYSCPSLFPETRHQSLQLRQPAPPWPWAPPENKTCSLTSLLSVCHLGGDREESWRSDWQSDWRQKNAPNVTPDCCLTDRCGRDHSFSGISELCGEIEKQVSPFDAFVLSDNAFLLIVLRF